jgi:tetratricopeptide (TPR) repeat protein
LDGFVEPPELEAAVREAWDFDDPAASYDAMTAQASAAPPGSPAWVVWQSQAARALGLLGRFGEANHLLDQCQALLETLAGSPAGAATTRHAWARVAIERGRVLNSSGEREEARPWFEQARGDAAAVGGLAGLEVDALHMLAIVAASPEASLDMNLQALALAETSTDPEARRWRGSLLNNLGWDHHDAGRFGEALDCFERALDVRREADDPGGAHVAEWAVARALRSLERYDDALARQKRLAATAEGADDGYVHEEIGECLLSLGREDEAAPSFARAHALLAADPWMADHESDRLDRLARLGKQA